MEVDQLVDPGVDARGDRSVRGQQEGVGSGPHDRKGVEEGAERVGGEDRLEADRGGDGRQDVVTGEQQPGGEVVEHQVPCRVARCGHRFEGAAARQVQRALGEPLVRELPVGPVHLVIGEQRGQLVGDGPGAQRPQLGDLGVHRGPVLLPDQLHGGPFTDAEPDGRAELTAYVHRLRVVVAVDVRDEEPAHVAE